AKADHGSGGASAGRSSAGAFFFLGSAFFGSAFFLGSAVCGSVFAESPSAGSLLAGLSSSTSRPALARSTSLSDREVGGAPIREDPSGPAGVPPAPLIP